MQNLTLRKSLKSDADFAVPLILETLRGFVFLLMSNDKKVQIDLLRFLFLKENNIFSYKKTLILENAGNRVGCLIAYPYSSSERLDDQFERELNSLFTRKTYQAILKKHRQYFDLIEAEQGDYYIQTIAVLDEYRQHGYATYMLSYCESEAKKLKCQQLGLLVEPENTQAILLYQKFGFVKKRIQNNGAGDIVKMVKLL